MRNLEIGDWRGAFRFKDDGVIPWDMSRSAEENDDIRAPDSMPAERAKRSMPDFVEWHNPCYSHGPSKNGPEDLFSEAVVPRTAAAAEAADAPAQPAARYDGRRSGPAWTVALSALWGCRDIQGLKASLHVTGRVVLDLLPSELSKAFVDYERAIKEKRAKFIHIFTPSGDKHMVMTCVRASLRIVLQPLDPVQ